MFLDGKSFLDAIASLDLGMEVGKGVIIKPFSVHNHSKMLLYLLDVWSCFI